MLSNLPSSLVVVHQSGVHTRYSTSKGVQVRQENTRYAHDDVLGVNCQHTKMIPSSSRLTILGDDINAHHPVYVLATSTVSVKELSLHELCCNWVLFTSFFQLGQDKSDLPASTISTVGQKVLCLKPEKSPDSNPAIRALKMFLTICQKLSALMENKII